MWPTNGKSSPAGEKGGGGGDRNQLIALTNGMPGMIGEQGTPFLIHMAGLGPNQYDRTADIHSIYFPSVEGAGKNRTLVLQLAKSRMLPLSYTV